MVQRVDAFGRRGGEHVSQVFAQELMDIVARGVIPVNRNHALQFTVSVLGLVRLLPCSQEVLPTRTEDRAGNGRDLPLSEKSERR